jgi:hypothetical protein
VAPSPNRCLRAFIHHERNQSVGSHECERASTRHERVRGGSPFLVPRNTDKNGKLLAALRSSKVDMHYALSQDQGKTWEPVKSFGFKGHCPYFLRHSSGVILLAHRVPATSLHWTADEGKTWNGPAKIDTVGGAYPSCEMLVSASR